MLKLVVAVVMMTAITLGVLHFGSSDADDPTKGGYAFDGQKPRGIGHAELVNTREPGKGAVLFGQFGAGPKRVVVQDSRAGVEDENGRVLPKFTVIARRGAIRTASVAPDTIDGQDVSPVAVPDQTPGD